MNKSNSQLKILGTIEILCTSIRKRVSYIATLPVCIIVFIGSTVFGQVSTTTCTPQVLEMSNGNGSVASSSSLNVTMTENTNNPTGNTFAAYTPTLSVNYSIASNSTTGWTFHSYDNVGGIGGLFSNDNNFTSVNSAPGTGISRTSNFGARFDISTTGLVGNASVNGPINVGTMTITFNRPVKDPIFHFTDLGGFRNSKNFSSAYELVGPSGASLTRLSGNSTTAFAIRNGNTVYRNQANGFGFGSVQVNGIESTSFTFNVYMEAQDGNAWTSGGVETVIMSASYLDYSGPNSISGNVQTNTGTNISGVGITLYSDLNANGVLDADELAAGPAQIDSNNDGTVDSPAVAVTDGSGNYTISGVFSSNYIIRQTQPSGYASVSDGDSSPDTGGDIANTNTNDNDIPVSVCDIEADLNNNFVELVAVGTISGTVWDDQVDNNQFDKSTGASGVTVELRDGSNNVIASTTTAGDGTYSFSSIPPGNYTIVIASSPKPLQYDNDDSIDGANDGEENNAGSNTAGLNTSDGIIPVSIVGGGVTEVDSGNDFIISSFSNNNAPLPVNLIKFNAFTKDDKISIEWSTESEMGNRGFELMHSIDAKQFTSLGFVEGKGNTNERVNYTFDHEYPIYGINYYQLYQYDLNKSTPSKSKIIAATYDNENGIMLLYPNPSSSKLKINGVKIGDHLKVFNTNGVLLIDRLVNVDNRAEINVESFKSGTYYFVVVRNGLKIMSDKLIKQ